MTRRSSQTVGIPISTERDLLDLIDAHGPEVANCHKTGRASLRESCCSDTADTPGMDEQTPSSGLIDLDALNDYLMSDHAPDDCMGLSDLDGFLTGIVVGPELIMPSEWMPMIWGGDEPLFETEQEMQVVLGTIMGRYNEIAACFNANAAEFEPIFWRGQRARSLRPIGLVFPRCCCAATEGVGAADQASSWQNHDDAASGAER